MPLKDYSESGYNIFLESDTSLLKGFQDVQFYSTVEFDEETGEIPTDKISVGLATLNTEKLSDAEVEQLLGKIKATALTSGDISQPINVISGHIQSANFVSGASGAGWRIDGDGNLEAASGTFRGNVTGATITGGTFQTSTSGARIVLENDIFKVYDSSGNLRINTDSEAIKFLDSTGTNTTGGIYGDLSSTRDALILTTQATPLAAFILISGETGVVTESILVQGNTLPQTNESYVLGSSTKRWNGLCVANLAGVQFYSSTSTLNAQIIADSTQVQFNIGTGADYQFGTTIFQPSNNDTIHLGATTKQWKNLYLAGNIIVGGTVDGVDIAAHDGGAITTYHSGSISTTMHGTLTGIPNAHHNRSHDHSNASDGTTIKPSYCYVNYASGGARLVVGGNLHIQSGSIDFKTTALSIASGGSVVFSRTGADCLVYNNFRPNTDNSKTCGSSNERWSDVRTVLLNGSDIVFENNWTLTEHYMVGIKEKGIAMLNEENELQMFMGENNFYTKPLKDIKELKYTKTTQEERIKIAGDRNKKVD